MWLELLVLEDGFSKETQPQIPMLILEHALKHKKFFATIMQLW